MLVSFCYNYFVLVIIAFFFHIFFFTFLYECLILFDLIVLQVLNHFQNARCLFASNSTFHPLHDQTMRIDTLNLLQERAIDFTFVITCRSNSDVVDIHLTNDIFASAGSMFDGILLIAMARNNELILARLASINVIVRVEEGPV